ncbi:hypothetical protein DFH28DRAFT_1024970 [Melampsora americana]|nr:hypothetical protein DFH28DRAFT_1024970 [Melampsora americana]
MKLIILGLYAALACCVHCHNPITAFSHGASSLMSTALDPNGFNSAVVSGVKWNAQYEGMRQRLRERKKLQLLYNRKDGALVYCDALRDRHTMQQKDMIAPDHPPMQSTVHSDEKMYRIAQGVDL